MSTIPVCHVFNMFLCAITVLPSGIKYEYVAVMHDLLLYRCDFLQTAVPQDAGIKLNYKCVECRAEPNWFQVTRVLESAL